MTGRERGQAFTLEGVVGTLIVLTAVVFALQAVEVAPFADDQREASTESLRVQVQDLLAAASDSGALGRAVTCVDAAGEPDINVANPGQPVTDFGALLNRTLVQTGTQYSATVEYREGGGGGRRFSTEDLYTPGQGTPPDRAVSATHQLVLNADDPVYRAQGNDCVEDPGGQTVAETSGFYVGRHPDAPEAGPLYNVVRIRVIAW